MKFDLGQFAGQWDTVNALLDQALNLPANERATWVDSLAGEQARFKGVLQRLLTHSGAIETDDFLGTLPKFSGAADARPGAKTDLVAGDAIGPYRLLGVLGSGGMGAVWLAERADGNLKRKVALKLPHLSWEPSLAERMARERDILAKLEHPHIARLYDAGLDQHGRPYLALEYVDGLPIDTYCQQHALPLKERLALVLQVAAAVAHAHARLVVHRDLKPSNILVTADGDVRLLDFGIAKLLQGDAAQTPDLTQVGARALTPDYASPEQIRGEAIGTASDVYSLGVVAYELLAQTRPYRLNASTPGQMEAAIAALDAPLASTAASDPGLQRQLKGDLDAILNKALKKNPVERYASIDAFAQDITRHLQHQPVSAQPDRLIYRARKFLARYTLQVAAGAVVFVAVLAGSGVALWQAHQAQLEAARAEQVKEFVLAIFDSADTDSGAGAATTAVDLLTSARKRVETELANRPQIAAELMTAIGSSLLGQGRTDDAGEILKKAADLSERVMGPEHPRTLRAKVMYGEALYGLGRNKETIALLQPTIAAARRAHETRSVVNGLRSLSSAQLDEGATDAGVESSRQAVEALTAGTVRPLDAMDAWSSYANALNVAQRDGQVEAARQALALAPQIYGTRLTLPVIDARLLLAQGMIRQGQVAEGMHELDSLLPATVTLVGPAHPRVRLIANFLGNSKLETGDVLGAIAALRTSLDASAQASAKGAAPPAFERGMDLYTLASAYAAARRFEAALPLQAEAAELFRESAGALHPMALRSLSARALTLARLGRLDESDKSFAALAALPWAGPDKAAHEGRLAALRSLQQRHAEALALAQSAADVLQKFPARIVQANVLNALGSVRIAAGQAAPALEPLQRAHALYEALQPAMSPDHADLLVALGRVQLQLGDARLALVALDSADRFWQGFDGGNRSAALAALYRAQALLRLDARDPQAGVLIARAAPVVARSPFAADRALLLALRAEMTPRR